jgi:hypothetical protein
VIAASCPLPSEVVKAIVTFETPSSTEWQAPDYPNPFSPNLFVDISNIDIQIERNCIHIPRIRY